MRVDRKVLKEACQYLEDLDLNELNTLPLEVHALYTSRKTTRRPLETDVFVREKRTGVELVGRSSNLGITGILLNMNLMLAVGEPCQLSFALPGTGLRIVAEGEVVRNDLEASEGAMAVRFTALKPADREALVAFVFGQAFLQEARGHG